MIFLLKPYNGFSPQQREKASRIQREAIKSGRLKDPNECACSICGQDKGIRHYHNEDYSDEMILENCRVVCWRCHMMIHKRFRHPESFAKYMIDVVLYKKQYPPVYRANDCQVLNQHLID